ncbi:MAG TPA: haloacid dehalogenase-like hydrolase [Acetobacteraceae bacterium]|jgi:phosphoserine phosphatase
MRHADADPVLIFDLDETILRVNSFPLWVRFLAFARLPGLAAHRRALLTLRVLSLTARRKLHRIDHDTLLRQLQQAWRTATQGRGDTQAAAFQARLLREVRANLGGVLQRVADGRLNAVLATAAAADYAIGLGRQIGFRHVLATPADDERPERNAGVRKRDRVLALLRDLGWDQRPRILFTDHIDDLPLMQACDVTCWFGDSRASTDGIRVTSCLDLDIDALEVALDRVAAALQCDHAAAHSKATVS